MRVCALLLALIPLSQGCNPMRTSIMKGPPCNQCLQNLGNSNLKRDECEVHRTCISCTATQVNYSRPYQCLTASITCPDHLPFPRIRLLMTDNTDVVIDYNNATLRGHSPSSGFTCTGSSWRYNNGTMTIYNIRKALCFGMARGTQLSPINIILSQTEHTPDYDASKFTVKYGQGIVQHVEMHKDHSGFHVAIDPNAKAFFSASHLDNRYRLVQYHAHWNKYGRERGSEHLIDGKFYPAEFHFVHIREDFATFDDAREQNGIAVIAVFAALSPENNTNLDPLIEVIEKCNALPDIEKCHLEEQTDSMLFDQDPADLIPTQHSYLSYTGSLTTGGFQTCVAWNVLRTPITISQHQLDVLGDLINENYKEVVGIEKDTIVYSSDVRFRDFMDGGEVQHRQPPIVKQEEDGYRQLLVMEEGEDGIYREVVGDEADVKLRELPVVEEGMKQIQTLASGISFDDLEMLHRLLQKYGQNMNISELKTTLLEWMN